MSLNTLALAQKILDAASAHQGDRFIVGIAGAPGAGKSTVSELLLQALQDGISDGDAVLVPMDGFHLDNVILDARDLRSKKGAPETFDCVGYMKVLERIRANVGETFSPSFDRKLDLARAGAICIAAQHKIILTEGNYLLLDEAPWCDVQCYFDLTICIEADMPTLERRLMKRWLDHGLSDTEARQRAELNDLPNARYVVDHSMSADILFLNGDR